MTAALPDNIVRHGEPSRSAWRVAELRAVHQLLDDPLVLPDPCALPLLGAAAAARLRGDPHAFNDPVLRGLRAAMVARSRYVEDELARGVAAGVRQYVVLGAGLDTYGCRMPEAGQGLQVFEVDHAGTQRWKRRLLAEAGFPEPAALHFVAMDFEHDDLHATLARAGFDGSLPACVGWMGVTPYLTADALQRVFAALARLAPGSSVCFDYRVSPALLDPVQRAVSDALAQQLAALGEPWLSDFEPDALRARLLRAGFAAVHSPTAEEINARYFARRSDGLRVGGGSRLVCACTAASGGG